LVEAPDVQDRIVDRRADLGREAALGALEIGRARLEPARGHLGPVELAGEADQRLVALLAHRLDDRPHRVEKRRQIRLGPLEEPGALDRAQPGQLEPTDRLRIAHRPEPRDSWG